METKKRYNIESIKPEILNKISVKISCEHDQYKTQGTGTIVYDNGQYYVLTAAHCILYKKGEEEYKFSKEEIVIEQIYGRPGSETINSIEIQEIETPNFDEFIDSVVIKINNPKEALPCDVRLLDSEPCSSSKVYIFATLCINGRMFVAENKREGVWSIPEIREQGETSSNLEGSSGGGLFIMDEEVLYCIGYIKSLYYTTGKFSDILILPTINFSHHWQDLLISTESDKNSNSLITERPSTEDKQEIICKNAEIEYTNHWRDLYTVISNNEEASAQLEAIRSLREKYPFAKSISYQDEVFTSLIRRTGEEWREDYKYALLFAMKDMALYPSLYEDILEKINGIKDIPLYKELETRGKTLSNPNINTYNDKDDKDIFESIINAAFCFEFNKMYDLVSSWQPKGQWLVHKAMYQNLFGRDDSSMLNLGEYIDSKTTCPDNLFTSCIVYNVLDPDLKKKYSYQKFWENGIESPTEVLNFITDNIDKNNDKLKLFGVHYTLRIGGEDYKSFPESLRALQYIIDKGLTPSYKFYTNISIERWYKICRYQIRTNPYPILFYSMLYNNDKLLKKLGQVLAFEDDQEVINKLPKILECMFKAIESDHTPNLMYQGIYQLSGQLYIAINENKWFDNFKRDILDYVCNGDFASNVSVHDAIFENIISAVKSTKNINHRREIFVSALELLSKNKYLANVIINDTLKVEAGFADEAIKSRIEQLIINNPLSDSYCILYALKKSDNLNKKELDAIDEKAKEESFSFAIGNCSTLGMLSDLLSSEVNFNKIKEIILSSNMWNCGIKEEGNCFSLPNSLHLERLSTKIKWNEEEWNLVKENINYNLSLLCKEDSKNIKSTYFNNAYLELLSEMKKFICIHKNDLGDSFPEIESRINEAQKKIQPFSLLVDGIISNDFNLVIESYKQLYISVVNYGLDEYKSEVDLLISKVIMKNIVGIDYAIYYIALLATNCKETIIDCFNKKLILVLKSLVSYNYEELDVNVPFVNRNLKLIANALIERYPENEYVLYWTTDASVNRFNY